MKKIISILLVVILLSSYSSFFTFAVDSSEYTQDSITVDFNGETMSLSVFVSESGTVLVPADILTFLGRLTRRTSGSEYVYSRSGSLNGDYLERQIRISTNGNYGKSVVTVPGKSSLSGVEVTFSDSYTYDGDLYLPLQEVVPFLDAKIEIEKGILHIYPNPVSVFEAISYGSLYELFDSDYKSDRDNILFDLSDGNGSWALSLFVDSLVNGNLFGRIDFIFHSGQIKDYKAVFQKLLCENDAYLAAFNEEETPLDSAFSDIEKYLGTGKKFVKVLDDKLDLSDKVFKYMIGSDNFKYYNEFSDDIDSFGEISLIAEKLHEIVKCADVTMKMVDDHYEMLDVVYGRKDLKGTIAGTAAKESREFYSGKGKAAIKPLVESTVRDWLSETVSKPAQTIAKPFTAVFEIFKYIPGMDDLSRDYDVYYVETIVSDSRKAFVDYYNSMTFDRESLNDIRLSLLMTLFASKYGYDISAMFPVTEDKNDIQYGSAKNSNRLEINWWLEKIYLAADSVECCTPEYYSEMNKELSDNIQYLQLGEYVTPDTPDDSEASEGLEFTLNGDGQSYSVTGIGTCTDTDIVIPSTFNGLPVTSIGDYAFSGCTSLTSVEIPDSVTSIGYYAFYECTSLTSIEVDGNNKYYKSIDGNLYCKDGKTLIQYAIGKQDKSFTIPDSVTSIGDWAFVECTSLTSVEIGDSVTSIGEWAFYFCTSLTSVEIGDSVTSIGDWAFCGCTSLTSINFSGTKAQWNAIEKGYDWNYYTGNYTVYCTDGTISKDGTVTYK